MRFKKPSPIQTKSGTNHNCTNYKLHPKIDELLPKDEDNETLIESHKNTNETLDKIRLDKTSQDKTSLIVSNSTENNVSVASICEDAKTQGDDFGNLF